MATTAQAVAERDSSQDSTSWAVHVAGRGKLRATATATRHGVLIRLDDDRNPEFWAEVMLSEGQVIDMAQQVEKAKAEA